MPMQKQRIVGKKIRKGKGIRIALARLSSTFRPKDPCYGPLTGESQRRAAEAHAMFNLDLLDGKLKCNGCGKMVSAMLDAATGSFLVSPRPHERYKEPRQPARKRDYGKRM
jgi:hypothetical protein